MIITAFVIGIATGAAIAAVSLLIARPRPRYKRRQDAERRSRLDAEFMARLDAIYFPAVRRALENTHQNGVK